MTRVRTWWAWLTSSTLVRLSQVGQVELGQVELGHWLACFIHVNSNLVVRAQVILFGKEYIGVSFKFLWFIFFE